MNEMGTVIVESLGSAEFIAGLRWGLLATGVALPIGLVWRARAGKAAPVQGVLVAVVFLAAAPVVRPIGSGIWVAISLLVIAGVLHVVLGTSPLLASMLALPGAWWLVDRAGIDGDWWLEWLIASVVVLGAPLVASFDELDSARAWGPGFWLLSVAGIFAGVPDTEEALVLLGVSAPLALLGWPLRLVHIGPGVISLLAVFMWVAAWGGRGRPSATVAVVVGLGLLLVEPLVRWLRNRTLPPNTMGAFGAGSLQVVMVLLASRWAARYASVTTATVLAVAVLVLGAVGLVALRGGISRRLRR